MWRVWKDKVVVIAGAASAIGRATALALARQGAHLVLAARREEPLDELARACETLGAHCLYVPTDVTDAAEVRALAAEAVQTFGRIDGWVNSAGVYLVGRLEETPDDAFRQVMETNFFGTVHGSRSALAQFRRQGRGVLINVSSIFGSTTVPYVSAYAASKVAVRGFSASIRQEFEGAGIHVCTILPSATDAPLREHSANYTGWRIRSLEPIYAPERVAHAIVRVLEHPRRELFIGPSFRAFALLSNTRSFERPRQPRTSDHRFLPVAQGAGRDESRRSPARLWFKRLLLAGGLFATVASLRRAAA
ncbi:SDR family NAD(P)-dependent oxidoreductase [Hyalangium versicolor]|uniref:SDR family NAD(P)-dependent oxidoreductase n=1 Tax=Hyalangium versicolor TaxID=2861190 RepID=UPI001CCFA0A7|nr:SDR family NAD(P)-dependent oxidoreductase [Hyalangium versicolor]